jgi:hypothetical protein
MFHFPAFPPRTLYIQVRVTRYEPSRVSPFGHPRITARLPAPRGLSQAPTSFIGSWCQGIHRMPLQTYTYPQLDNHPPKTGDYPQNTKRCSRPLYSSQATTGPDPTPRTNPHTHPTRAPRAVYGRIDPEETHAPTTRRTGTAGACSLRTQQRATTPPPPDRTHRSHRITPAVLGTTRPPGRKLYVDVPPNEQPRPHEREARDRPWTPRHHHEAAARMSGAP